MLRRPVRLRLIQAILLTSIICRECCGQFAPITTATPDQESSVARLIAQARASLKAGDIEGERISLEQALALAPTNRQARLALTEALMRLGHWKEAESEALLLATRSPSDTEPVFLLAMIAMRRGDPKAAKEFASRCLTLGDTQPEVYKALALSEYLLQDTG